MLSFNRRSGIFRPRFLPLNTTIGNSNYSSLQVTLRHNSGPQRLLAACTYSKSLDRSSNLGEEVNPLNASISSALYLLFNEGYHGASPESAVRADLCQEAMRLTAVLLDHPLGTTPSTYALAALMCLGAARLPGRLDASGDLSSLFDQDRSRWDRDLVAQGLQLLELSATGPELTAYHVEAALALAHASAVRAEDTDWGNIVSLYDTLMTTRPSPVVALNRAIAVAQNEGPQRGLEELGSIAGTDRLAAYPFYPAALGELEFRCGRQDTALQHFRTALALARNPMERFLDRRVNACGGSDTSIPVQ